MIFRVVIFGILIQTGYSDYHVNLITSILFSVCNSIDESINNMPSGHAHNIVHIYQKLGPVRAIGATGKLIFSLFIITCCKVFQMMFTFVFAFYCGKIMLKFQCYYCAAMLHAYCNALGLPPVDELFPIDLKDGKKLSK